jgi:hypothetical protein
MSRLHAPRIHPLRFATFVLVVLALGGCPGGDGAIDDDDDDGITGPDIPEDPEAGEYAARALSADLDAILGNLMVPGGPAECVTMSSPWEDADQDGVPDDLVFTHSLEGCKFTLDAGSWGSTSGTIHVTDAGAAWGFDATLTALARWSHQANDDSPRTFTWAHTGTTHVSGSGTQVGFAVDHDVLFRVTGEPDANLTEDWSGTWVPTGTEPFAYTLAPGTMTLSGTSVFSRNTTSIHLSLETVTPLRWEASCDAIWPQAGVVRAHVTSGGPSGYLEMAWSDCWKVAEVNFFSS